MGTAVTIWLFFIGFVQIAPSPNKSINHRWLELIIGTATLVCATYVSKMVWGWSI